MKSVDRRTFLLTTGVATAAASLGGFAFAQQDGHESHPYKNQEKHDEQGKGGNEKEQVEVTPTEDLMREHGLLNRILLIYDHSSHALQSNQQFDVTLLASAAGIIRTFIEQYHEKLEEDHIFPRFEKANKLAELVKTLRAQHEAGRRVTGQIEQLSKPTVWKNATQRTNLQHSLAAFVRMYRPHEAREDTILFPALHTIVSKTEFDAMGDQFESQEHKMFGEEGFEGQVGRVGELEKKLGIFDLAQFTPR
jgi:hemerythrin-like domain-containing protein